MPSSTMRFFHVATFALLAGCGSDRFSVQPKNGMVPDSATAIAIAVAVWNPIYGKDHIAGESPYEAKLTSGVWTVNGSLPKGMTDGGVAEIDIDQYSGRILRLSHGK